MPTRLDAQRQEILGKLSKLLRASMLFERGSVPSGPPIETRKALLLLDFQNDFIETDGNLPVSNATSFIPRLLSLVNEFRSKGQVIWIGTEYLQPRTSISTTAGTLSIVLKQHLAAGEHSREGDDGPIDPDEVRSPREDPLTPSSKVSLMHDREAFLAPVSTFTSHRCCMPDTIGAQYPEQIQSTIDHSSDIVLTKSHYSAFEGTNLLMLLRMRAITEVYVCGTLSTIGVHATVLDAVCHGIKVTLIEDCLGFLDDACHVEAVKRMVDELGAGGIDCQELRDDLAGLLGDVFNEEALTTRMQVSIAPAARPRRSNTTRRQIEDWISTANSNDADAVKTGYDGTPPKDSEAGTAKASDSHRDSSTHRPGELATSRKRSTSDDLSPEDRASKSSQKPSDRRYSVQPEQFQALTNQVPEASIISAGLKTTSSELRSRTRSAEKFRRRGSRSPELSRLHPKSSAMDSPSPARPSSQRRKKRIAPPNIVGPGDVIGTGDSALHIDVLDASEADEAFQHLRSNIVWQKMYHKQGEVPRLVAVQGTLAPSPDGTGNDIPIYRHPADDSPDLSPFESVVDRIRQAAEKTVGHTLNHALIQYYRTSEDNISEHSDKTLDIVYGSKIINVSLGAQRTMILRAKKSSLPSTENGDVEQVDPSAARPSQRIPLPHNSIFILGSETNQHYLHSIRADRRLNLEKSPEELAFDGERISLTFRKIGTFINTESQHVWGQGATSKTRDDAKPIMKGDRARAEADKMLKAFGIENHESITFDWQETYGAGFDVLGFENNVVSYGGLAEKEDSGEAQQEAMPRPQTDPIPAQTITNSDMDVNALRERRGQNGSDLGMTKPTSPTRTESAPF